MLAYLARTLPLLLRARLSRERSTVSRLRRRVRPSEVDLNLHMNQAAYAQVMELARADWLLRSGAWDRWLPGANPVVAEQRIVYRRELRPLASYVIDSRAVGVDGRLLRFEHHLIVGDRVHARGELKLLFVGPDGVLDAAQVERLSDGLLVEPLDVVDWRLA